jgi:hypothetical protein
MKGVIFEMKEPLMSLILINSISGSIASGVSEA